jgi:uncharacterized protein YbjQ (UPF0145 family)
MRCQKCGIDYPSDYYFKTRSICNSCYEKLSPEERKSVVENEPIAKGGKMRYPMTTTAFTIDGYQIKTVLGVVRGIVVRSRSIFGTIGASLHTIVGGNITLFTELCEKTRSEAFEMMVQHAEEIGANAVIGVRYDATEIMSSVTEVLCYGTAVVVEKTK